MQTATPDTEALIRAQIKKIFSGADFQRAMAPIVTALVAKPEPQGIVLPFLSGKRHVRVIDRIDGIYVTSDDDSIEFNYYRTRGNDFDRGHRKPNTWWGGETRIDASGRLWSSSLPEMVQDDFGNLVVVPA